jgi:hypothetical protein
MFCHVLHRGKGQLKLFNIVFQKYVMGDESGHFCGALNAALENGWMPPIER